MLRCGSRCRIHKATKLNRLQELELESELQLSTALKVTNAPCIDMSVVLDLQVVAFRGVLVRWLLTLLRLQSPWSLHATHRFVWTILPMQVKLQETAATDLAAERRCTFELEKRLADALGKRDAQQAIAEAAMAAGSNAQVACTLRGPSTLEPMLLQTL